VPATDPPPLAASPAATADGPGSPPAIDRFDELAARGVASARRAALKIALAGLEAVDVARATAAAVSLDGHTLRVNGFEHELNAEGRVIVVGAGKASLAIGRELERILGPRLDHGAIAVRGGEERPLERIEVLSADHPLPTDRSVRAAQRLLEVAATATERDIVIACFTGGSSSLACAPPPGVGPDDKRELHEVLLSAGVGIVEVNTVRKHVSSIKGGRLAAAVHPARLINLTVSDVAGDHLDAITDPTVPDSSVAADAIAVLRRHELWDRVPTSVRDHLATAGAESPNLDSADIQTLMLATGATACDAMALAATGMGLTPNVISTTLEGEAREVGRVLANLARSSATQASPFRPGTVLLGCGGESTVTLARDASFGDGGPNQEAALAAAIELDGAPVAAVFLDTDGSDGGTLHAGAVVDGQTAERAAAAGIDLRGALAGHKSHDALSALGDAIVTGPTGTNINDLFAIVVEEGA
jgi:hydroxypyruvate reductase/glycerate 2-kinase